MTTFVDGLAAGKTLMLRRAPLFLRVVCDAAGNVDALDQIGDEARPGETIHAYLKVGDDGMCHLSYTDARGRRAGGFFAMASYRLCAEQPTQEMMRGRDSWQNWCLEAARALKQSKENA